MFSLKQSKGIWYGNFSSIDSNFLIHAISTRLGGASLTPFDSLNLGLHTGDDVQSVRKNRVRFASALGVDANLIVSPDQVHGDSIAIVTDKDRGRGAFDYHSTIQATDALITAVPEVPLLLCFADCVPVLIVDPVNQVIGLSHAGWKGTVAKIGQKTLLAMQKNFGSRPEDCKVCIAPSIGPCCYEVDEVVIDKVGQSFGNVDPFSSLTANGKWKLDLWLANSVQMEEVGVSKENIESSGICTSCHNKLFYSYRKENGITGRLGALLMLQSR